MFANPEELLRYLRDEDVKFVDVRFCDLPGVMQHFNMPVESFDDSVITDGLAFDGSSIRGFQAIHESDMMLLPDVATAFIDGARRDVVQRVGRARRLLAVRVLVVLVRVSPSVGLLARRVAARLRAGRAPVAGIRPHRPDVPVPGGFWAASQRTE